MLKADNFFRLAFGMELRGGNMLQPWFKKKFLTAEVKGTVRLAFDFTVEQAPKSSVDLVMEQPECFRVTLNGKAIDTKPQSGWWVDNAFKRLAVPGSLMAPGKKELIVETDYREGINIEALYLTGDFGVRLEGPKKIITALPGKLAVGSLVEQGLPFYGGVVTYKIRTGEIPAEGRRLFVSLPEFNDTACIRVATPGQPVRLLAWRPYRGRRDRGHPGRRRLRPGFRPDAAQHVRPAAHRPDGAAQLRPRQLHDRRQELLAGVPALSRRDAERAGAERECGAVMRRGARSYRVTAGTEGKIVKLIPKKHGSC